MSYLFDKLHEQARQREAETIMRAMDFAEDYVCPITDACRMLRGLNEIFEDFNENLRVIVVRNRMRVRAYYEPPTGITLIQLAHAGHLPQSKPLDDEDEF